MCGADGGVGVGVLFDGEVDRCEADCFARPPAYALEREGGIGVVREGFVLCWVVSICF